MDNAAHDMLLSENGLASVTRSSKLIVLLPHRTLIFNKNLNDDSLALCNALLASHKQK
jgi:hypothetical protein